MKITLFYILEEIFLLFETVKYFTASVCYPLTRLRIKISLESCDRFIYRHLQDTTQSQCVRGAHLV